MLSEHERRQLARIEEGLEADPQLVASLRDVRRRRRRLVRVLIAFGILLILSGMLTNTGALVLQGFLAVGAGCAWFWWPAYRATRRSAP
jgi:hypothetical protein